MTSPADAGDSNNIGEWPTGRNRIGPAGHVHAFGIIAMTSAMLEEVLLLLLISYLPMGHDAAVRIATALNNRERSDLLRELVGSNETDTDLKERLLHALTCCDICIDNRNMLIHSLYVRTDKLSGAMQMTKRARNNPIRELRFQVSLKELRLMAEETGDTVNYMLDLWFVKRHLPDAEPASSLGTLLKPRRLTIPQN